MLKKEIWILLVFLIFFTSPANAQQSFTHVISNSEDWRDVYSIMMYAKFNNVGSDFLVSTKHGPILMTGINKDNYVRVVSSKKSPFVLNYDSDLKNAGFKNADEVKIGNADLELISDLSNVNNFIIIGNTYGYNAIAVAPYAVVNKAWVFFASRSNIAEIDSILSIKKPKEVIIYGFVDREVRDTLSKYIPEIIDTGDRFKDDIEITKKYLEINPTKQVLLSNGEFIENELMSGSGPILFTGKQNVPDQIRDYIKSSDIEVGVLIGADLVGTATNIRRSTGISVIVKFARGARVPTGAIASVEGLDLFYLPIPIMDLELHSAKYNKASSQLELTYKSNSNIPIFFKGTITPKTESGEKTKIGDVEPIFIAPNDYKTISYSGLDLIGDSISLDVFALFGDTPTSLEKVLEKNIKVEIVNVLDNCDIEIHKVKYSKPKQSFYITIKNKADYDCWIDVELKNIIVDNIEETIGSEGSISIFKGKSNNLIIKQEMTNQDLEKNQFVNVVAYYGEREDSLVKMLQGRFALSIETISFATIGLISFAFIIIAAIIILFIVWKRRKDEEDF